MNLFDQLVEQAVRTRSDLAPLRPAVEKELLHHDILREMSEAGLLSHLVFIGGTCLRVCYGSQRLSEDLDFTGGAGFSRENLEGFGGLMEERIEAKYGLQVRVAEPVRETGNVDTWKIRIETRPERPDLPSQRIHIDVAAIPSYDPRPMLLRNAYGIEMGTSGLIVRAQSREEIFADKLLAFALRPNRLKNRDLWDIAWLRQQNVELPLALIPRKIEDHRQTRDEFCKRLRTRREQLLEDSGLQIAFHSEMRRFLPPESVSQTIANPEYWEYIVGEINAAVGETLRFLGEC